MEFLKTFEELRSLPSSTKVSRVYEGNIDFITIVGIVNQNRTGVVVIYNSDSNIKFLYEKDFTKNQYTLDYDSKEVGLLMIKQLKAICKSEIENITESYLK